ncbi:M91 family zinc metallopeptidase [Pseudomonas trivialis]|uniref:M91 family zinc metallopeptidase n=1 Tax=Pseudomonas trivialis TaxID=200450 RepID=UPI0030D4F5C5
MTTVTSHHNHAMAPEQPSANTPSGPPPVQTHRRVLVDDGNLRAGQALTLGLKNPERPETLANALFLETGERADRIHISQRPDGQLYVQVNGRDYVLDTPDGRSNIPTLLHIKSAAGDDRITIAPNVNVRVEIDAGDGNDVVQAGGGKTCVYGGRGDDDITLGSDTGYAEGNEGNDILKGGRGHAVMYGNTGNDRLYAGSGPANKQSHLDGGAGNDQLYAGNGHTVLNGGLGDDLLVGHDSTTFYSGSGRNTLRANAIKARIHAQATDHLMGTQGSTVTPVTPTDTGRQAFSIQGPPDFVARVEDDLTLLRTSPQGQKMLKALDEMAVKNGSPVLIVPSDRGNSYRFWSTELQHLAQSNQVPTERTDPKWGYIKDGVPGSRADKGMIFYNPATIYGTDPLFLPLNQLFHEMAHAWNGANGTFLPGSSAPTRDQPELPGPPNSELQAVGLVSNAPPFDFDNNASTPPTSTNPAPFTENTLNAEMGLALRTHYA